MDSESDYFSEVEEISDISRDLPLHIPDRHSDLNRCLQFVGDVVKVQGLRQVFNNRLVQFDCQLLTMPQLVVPPEPAIPDMFSKKRLTFGMRSDQASCIESFTPHAQTSYFGPAADQAITSSFSYLQQPMHTVLTLKDLNLSYSTTTSEQLNEVHESNVFINNLKLDINKLKQKYTNYLPDSMRQHLLQ